MNVFLAVCIGALAALQMNIFLAICIGALAGLIAARLLRRYRK
jgi:hypothetical protein